MRAVLGWFLKLVRVKKMVPNTKLGSLSSRVSHLFSPNLLCLYQNKMYAGVYVYVYTLSQLQLFQGSFIWSLL